MKKIFETYILPGLIFQGVLIGGGYGTGREIVEYFIQFGPGGALKAMFFVALPIWATVVAVTFEFARVFKAYDYRSFLLELLGPFWIAFEILYVVLLVIVLAVVGSASGVMLQDYFSIPYFVGVSTMLLAVAFLTFKGSGLIERFFALWSTFIYVVYTAFFVVALIKFGDAIGAGLKSGETKEGWQLSGFKYGLYNMIVIPAVLFAARHVNTRREALVSGALAAVIGLAPGFLFLVAILGQYPQVITEEIPAVFVMEKTGVTLLLGAFVVMLFGTLIQTGTGFIHGVNERLSSAFQAHGKTFPDWMRPAVAVGFLLASLALSSVGIIDLVSKGYSLMSWGIFAVFILPLLTYGVYKVASAKLPTE